MTAWVVEGADDATESSMDVIPTTSPSTETTMSKFYAVRLLIHPRLVGLLKAMRQPDALS